MAMAATQALAGASVAASWRTSWPLLALGFSRPTHCSFKKLKSRQFNVVPERRNCVQMLPWRCKAIQISSVDGYKQDEESWRNGGDDAGFYEKLFLTTAASLSPLLLDEQNAYAVQGEFGILEGRSVALIHPLVMGGLFFFTLYAGYLGWQWRRVRTIQDEINILKKQVPAPAGDSTSPPMSPVEAQIASLTEDRKTLIKGGFRDRHFNAGSLLLGFGVLESVGGAVNTWFRTGKLFPGPHLFAGAAITVLWALAAALVPAMQKGNDTARSLHIALNVLNVLLFVSQIPTGLEIVGKVFEFTTWP